MKRTQLFLSATAVLLALSIMIGCKKKTNYIPAIYVKEGDKTISLNSTYSDPGATAQDDEDGDMTDKIEMDQSSLDVNQTGTYIIVYKVTDSDGNESKASRNITVINDAEAYFTGDYEVTDSITGSKENYTAKVVADSKVNNRIAFTTFYNWATDTVIIGGTDSVFGGRTIASGQIIATVNYTSINILANQQVTLQDTSKTVRSTNIINGTGTKIQLTSAPTIGFKFAFSLSYTDSIVGVGKNTRKAYYKKL